MSNAKGIGENQLICHQPLQSLNAVEFDREKRRLRRPKHRAVVQDDSIENGHHQSALGIRLFLREFCLAFLDNCYNILMPRARVSMHIRFHHIDQWRSSRSTGNDY
jgi:timeless